MGQIGRMGLLGFGTRKGECGGLDIVNGIDVGVIIVPSQLFSYSILNYTAYLMRVCIRGLCSWALAHSFRRTVSTVCISCFHIV